MPLDSADIVSDEVTATENVLTQLYRLRNEGKNLSTTIPIVEAKLRRAVDNRLDEELAARSAEIEQ